jgi:hypothetical protein
MFVTLSYETFRRVPQVYEPRRSSAHRFARGNAEARSGVSKTGGRKPTQARPKARLKKKAESSYAAFRFRPRCRRNLERDFRFFILLRRQFGIRQPLSDDLLTQQTETIRVVHRIAFGCTIVEPESLFVHVAEQVEPVHGNVISTEAAR